MWYFQHVPAESLDLDSVFERVLIDVGEEKLVKTLGERGRIPVEVIPLAHGYVVRKLKAIGLKPVTRPVAGGTEPFITDNGNLTLDCATNVPLQDGAAARALEKAVLEIAGVVDTGLFLGTAERVLIGYSDGRVDVRVAGS